MDFDIHRTEETGSTNDDVQALIAEGARPGAVVVARVQCSGHGQWNRVWVSPRGGLYFSVLLRPSIPEEKWPGISGRVAEGVAQVIREECGAPDGDVWVKAPNDVKCADGKLCGMSLDAKDGLVVLGVGVNVFHPSKAIVTDGRNVAAYVCDLAPAPGSLNKAAAAAAEGGKAHESYLDELLAKLLDAIEATGLFV